MKPEVNELEAIKGLRASHHGRVFSGMLERLSMEADRNLRKARGDDVGPAQGRAQILADLVELWALPH